MHSVHVSAQHGCGPQASACSLENAEQLYILQLADSFGVPRQRHGTPKSHGSFWLRTMYSSLSRPYINHQRHAVPGRFQLADAACVREGELSHVSGELCLS